MRWVSNCHFLGGKSIQIQSDDVPIYCHSELTSVHGPVVMSNSQPWRVSLKESPPPPLCHYPFPTGLDLPIHSILICSLCLCLLWHFLFTFSSLFSTSHVWFYQHFLTFGYMFSDSTVFCIEARSSFNSGLALGIPCIYITFYGSQSSKSPKQYCEVYITIIIWEKRKLSHRHCPLPHTTQKYRNGSKIKAFFHFTSVHHLLVYW